MSAQLERLQAGFAAGILGTGRGILEDLRPGARFDIYREAYRARLADALADTYGHTARYLGEDGFRELALQYIEMHVPSASSIRWYGDTFTDWLRGAHPLDPDVAELAALDWALRAAFDSADAEPLEAGALARLRPEDWEHVGFRLHPSFRMLEMGLNTVAVWQALDAGQVPPASAALGAGTVLAVWRKDLQPHFRTLDEGEDLALRSLQEGGTFAGVCARLAAGREAQEAAALAARWLRRWVDDVLLAGLR
jgi:hypothetical protein